MTAKNMMFAIGGAFGFFNLFYNLICRMFIIFLTIALKANREMKMKVHRKF